MPKVKDKERILKAAREKQSVTGSAIRLSADFSTETLQAGGAGTKYSKAMKNKNLHLRFLARLSFRIEGDIMLPK